MIKEWKSTHVLMGFPSLFILKKERDADFKLLKIWRRCYKKTNPIRFKKKNELPGLSIHLELACVES
jgi:hypothetical protein